MQRKLCSVLMVLGCIDWVHSVGQMRSVTPSQEVDDADAMTLMSVYSLGQMRLHHKNAAAAVSQAALSEESPCAAEVVGSVPQLLDCTCADGYALAGGDAACGDGSARQFKLGDLSGKRCFCAEELVVNYSYVVDDVIEKSRANPNGKQLLYLHGMGVGTPVGNTTPFETIAMREMVQIGDAWSEQFNASTPTIHAPSYHVGHNRSLVRIRLFVDKLAEASQQLPSGKFDVIVGESFGGLVAALFQEKYPQLVKTAILLSPAIDNYARNYERKPPSQWQMPATYVSELRSLSARPAINAPTIVIHGLWDTDELGVSPWRMMAWVNKEHFLASYFLPNIGHDLKPWLDSHNSSKLFGATAIPSFSELLRSGLQMSYWHRLN